VWYDPQQPYAERYSIVLLQSLLLWQLALGAQLPWHHKLAAAVLQLHIEAPQCEPQQQLTQPTLEGATAATAGVC
jgi:hypothetical protein